jgi:hypothetical protein
MKHNRGTLSKEQLLKSFECLQELSSNQNSNKIKMIIRQHIALILVNEGMEIKVACGLVGIHRNSFTNTPDSKELLRFLFDKRECTRLYTGSPINPSKLFLLAEFSESLTIVNRPR